MSSFCICKESSREGILQLGGDPGAIPEYTSGLGIRLDVAGEKEVGISSFLVPAELEENRYMDRWTNYSPSFPLGLKNGTTGIYCSVDVDFFLKLQ